MFHTLYGVLIIENDEHQHNQYSPECELARMQELFMAYGEAVHFIRFNPDSTLFQKDSLVDRHHVLFQKIKFILEDPQSFYEKNRGLSFQYLYYDKM